MIEVEELYKRLLGLEKLNEIGNVYCGSDTLEADWLVFYDIYEYIYEKYEEWEELPDWANAYVQIFSWQFQRYHEGVDTYYENFYENTDYNSVKRAGIFLEQVGYSELALGYNQVFTEGKWEEHYILEKLDTPYIEKWIDENEEIIQKFYFDVLKKYFFKSEI